MRYVEQARKTQQKKVRRYRKLQQIYCKINFIYEIAFQLHI